jgi:endonuclease YncB( thermonuclease family)
VRLVLAVLCGLCFLAGCDSRASGAAANGDAVVARIIDGDTIDVTIGGRQERVRLIGINTPEIAHPAFGDRPPNDAECYGDEAQVYTGELLAVGSGVRLERDVVARDDYGRLLAYVYRTSDGAFVNFEIVRHGFAQPLTIAPNTTFAELFVDAARAAERDDVGLWAACGRQ